MSKFSFFLHGCDLKQLVIIHSIYHKRTQYAKWLLVKTPYCSFTIYVWLDCFEPKKTTLEAPSIFIYFLPNDSRKCCFITHFLNSK